MSNRAEAKSSKERAESDIAKNEKHLVDFEEAAGQRLLHAVTLLRAPQVAGKVSNSAELQQEIKELVPAARLLSNRLTSVRKLRNRLVTLTVLLSQLERYQSHQPLIDRILSASQEVCNSLASESEAFNRADYPFEHADASMTLGKFFVPGVPHQQDVGDVHDIANAFLDKYFALRSRVTARLADIAEQVEAAVGLKQIAPKDVA